MSENINGEKVEHLLEYLRTLNDLNKNGVKCYEEIKRTIEALERELLV